MHSPSDIKPLYKALSALYKNPTSALRGLAAINVDDELFRRQRELLGLLNQYKSFLKERDPALLLKVLTLLYEIDDYFSVYSDVEDWIGKEADEFNSELDDVNNGLTDFQGPKAGKPGRERFTHPYNRSYWKARVICSVAAVESRRRENRSNSKSTKTLTDLTEELAVLERFVKRGLNQPADVFAKRGLHQPPHSPAWTTLAVIQAAQARIARQGQDYGLSEQKLLEATECLAKRANEIREKAHSLVSAGTDSPKTALIINELKDDLVSIQRKQTLLSFFNLALVALQRSFLRTANRACQSARLQFSLHGHNYHALFNELIIISIKRARTTRDNREKFRDLRARLRKDIIRHVRPNSVSASKGNQKLYLYALRELALIHSYLGQTKAMLKVLNLMEQSDSRPGDQWKARIEQQRARAFWLTGRSSEDPSLFQRALKHARAAFAAASGKNIDNYTDAKALTSEVKRSKRANRIETIESLITYGSILISAKKSKEAIKCAEAVIECCDEENPRLLAMGYLVRAEACFEEERILQAKHDVGAARVLLRRIDHTYVADRLRAIETQWFKDMDYLPLGDLKIQKGFFEKAKGRLRGHFIDHLTGKVSVNDVVTKLGFHKATVIEYLQEVEKDEHDPYHHLKRILEKQEKHREGAHKARLKKQQDNQAEKATSSKDKVLPGEKKGKSKSATPGKKSSQKRPS